MRLALYLGKATICTFLITIIWIIAIALTIVYREYLIIPVIVAVIITFITLRRFIDEKPFKEKKPSISALQVKELFESLSDDELEVLRTRLLKNASQEYP